MRLHLIIAFISAILFACASNDLTVAPVSGMLSKPAFGKEDQSVIYQIAADKSLDIHVKKIEEARCPSDVQCISAGYVKVIFEVGDVGDVELITPKFAGSNANESFEFSYNGHSYRITLNDVTPYPTTKNYEEAKSVQFVVEPI